MQLALYRAERPEIFEDIIGQKHIVRILQNQIRTGTVSQAYLFSGTHGTGKTSTARILAKAVNCTSGEPGTESAVLNADSPDRDGQSGQLHVLPCGHCENCEAIREGRFVDVIELDAASNNGVDDLRQVIEMVKYPPAAGRYKVYIIDEVHMLSTAAENAFLKTLEEPPEHAIFILATTDPQKVRATIRSRCMQLNFRRVTEEELADGMERICRKRGAEVTRDALMTIAARADGSVRDALSILEQCMAAGDKLLNRQLVLDYTGAAGEDFFLALTGAVAAGQTGKALVYIDEIVRRGKDSRQIMKDWLMHYRDLMVVKYVARPERVVRSSEENLARLKNLADKISLADIERAIRLLSEYINIGRYSERPRILLETAAVRLAGGLQMEPGGIAASSAGPDRPSSRVSAASAVSAASDASAVSATADQKVPEDRTGVRTAGSTGVTQEKQLSFIPAGPREMSGDPEEMWNRIVEEIAAEDRSFVSLVGKHSRGTDFENGELAVTVRPGKMRLANDKLSDIRNAVQMLYGKGVMVTLRSGDPAERSNNAGMSAAAGMTEQEAGRIIDDDVNVNDVAADVESLFGIKPEITN